MAARELPGLEVRVLDTGGLAMTHGFSVLAAARAAAAGARLEEAADIARAVASRAQLVGAVDTMRYLVKSGRVPWVIHRAASLLGIRPILAAGSDGVRSIARVRTAARASDELLRYLETRATKPKALHVAVMHAAAPERADLLAARIRERVAPPELLVTEFTTVMGVHTGPGFVGLAFYSDEGLPRFEPGRPRRPSLLERDVRVLEGALGELPPPVPHPPLVVLSGLPGSGKSHFARELVRRYPLARLESDRLRKALFKKPHYTPLESRRLFNACYELLDRLLARGVPALLDATNLKEVHRRPLYRIAEKHGARLLLVQLKASPEVIHRRLEERATGANPWDQSEAGHNVYERLQEGAEPIERDHIVVDSSRDTAAEVERIVREVTDVSE